MQIKTVSATIRYSQDTGKGAWKVVELGAEASVGDRKDWRQSQSELYYELGAQLRSLWSGGNTNGTAVNGHNSAETAKEPPAESAADQMRQHWCPQHKALFKRRQKAGTTWYSHKAPDGSWCSEPERE